MFIIAMKESNLRNRDRIEIDIGSPVASYAACTQMYSQLTDGILLTPGTKDNTRYRVHCIPVDHQSYHQNRKQAVTHYSLAYTQA
jgi:hypothetical protein